MSMEFEWYRPTVTQAFRDSIAASALAMHRHDVELRALLLLRLGRTRSEAVATCKRFAEWDFAGMPRPRVLGEIDALVATVYARHGRN